MNQLTQYRPNVGIVIRDAAGRVLWCKRCNQSVWQFPQGGIEPGETPIQAMYRELHEEVGWLPEQVAVLACSQDWHYYLFSEEVLRERKTSYIGQKQRWFLLQATNLQLQPTFDRCSAPEFDDWCWISTDQAIERIIDFKREVYRAVLHEFAPLLSKTIG